MVSSNTLRRELSAIGAALPNIVIFIAVLSIPLTAAQELGLSAVETTSWLLIGYGLAGIVGLALTLWYRQPLLITGNVFIWIFVSSLAGQINFAELVGASILAGLAIIPITMLGLTRRVAAWIPTPIVYGLLAGAIMPFVSGVFTAVVDAPVLVGGTFLAYFISRRMFGTRVPAILSALIAGLILTALTSQFGQVSEPILLPTPRITLPIFSLNAIATATPIFVILITFQANLPSLIFLRSQDYDPPERVINIVSGIGTFFGSFLGPIGISLSLPATSLAAGPTAGEHQFRHRSVYYAEGAMLLIGLLASIAAILPEIIPLPLLFALAGLALLDVLAHALQHITRGPLLLGPLLTFAIVLSQVSFLGFSSHFWAIVVGTGVSLLLEGEAVTQLQNQDEP